MSKLSSGESSERAEYDVILFTLSVVMQFSEIFLCESKFRQFILLKYFTFNKTVILS